MRRLRAKRGCSKRPEAQINTAYEPEISDPQHNYSYAELVNMLECPICMDTADASPIYQCCEGHLICKV